MAVRVWCYTLDLDFTTPVYDIGTNDRVRVPRVYHLYECDDDSTELSDDSTTSLYYVPGFPIDVYKLQEVIRNHTVNCAESIGGIDGTLYDLAGFWYNSCTIFKGA